MFNLFFWFQSVEGLKRWRLLGALALTKGESGDYGMCVGFIPQLELCDGWENGKVKRRIERKKTFVGNNHWEIPKDRKLARHLS